MATPRSVIRLLLVDDHPVVSKRPAIPTGGVVGSGVTLGHGF